MSPVAVGDMGGFSTKVLVGELREGELTLVGVGKSPSKGVKGSKIVKPSSASSSLRKATERAEEMASEEIDSIYLGVGGNGLNYTTAEPTITISAGDRIIKRDDLARLKDMAKSVQVGPREKIISVIPRGFALDGQKGVTSPVGLQGRRLDMKATVASVDKRFLTDFEKTATGADLDLAGLYPTSVPAGELLLTGEERERGKILIDLGMGTTELLVFKEGGLIDHHVFPLGGKNLTKDLSARLNVEETEARRIKHEFNLIETGGENETYSRKPGGENKGDSERREAIRNALAARTEEIFELLLSEITEGGHEVLLDYGINVTGGTARLSGLIEFLNDRFDPKFSLAQSTRPISGIADVVEDPSYGPALGLLNYVAELRPADRATKEASGQGANWLIKLFNKIRQLITAIGNC